MATELLDMGLTKEEIDILTNIGDQSLPAVIPLPDKAGDKTPKHRQKESKIKSSNKKKNTRRLEYLKSNDSGSDSSYESSDNCDFPRYPRGVPVHKQHVSKKIRGRGGPFDAISNIPHQYRHQQLTNSNTYGPNYTYDHFNKMERELNHLIQMTNSSQFRNDNIEKIWNQNNVDKNTSNAQSIVSERNNNSVPESSDIKNVKPIRQSPLATEKVEVHVDTAQVVDNNEKSYKNVLEGKLETLCLNQTDSATSSDSGKKKRKDVKLKTQLYIPPHLRKRNGK